MGALVLIEKQSTSGLVTNHQTRRSASRGWEAVVQPRSRLEVNDEVRYVKSGSSVYRLVKVGVGVRIRFTDTSPGTKGRKEGSPNPVGSSPPQSAGVG